MNRTSNGRTFRTTPSTGGGHRVDVLDVPTWRTVGTAAEGASGRWSATDEAGNRIGVDAFADLEAAASALTVLAVIGGTLSRTAPEEVVVLTPAADGTFAVASGSPSTTTRRRMRALGLGHLLGWDPRDDDDRAEVEARVRYFMGDAVAITWR